MAAPDVFVDTAGFLSLWDAGDEHHRRGFHLQEELVRRNRRFLTTEYVVEETVTLLLVRQVTRPQRISSRRSNAARRYVSEWINPARFHSGQRVVSEAFR